MIRRTSIQHTLALLTAFILMTIPACKHTASPVDPIFEVLDHTTTGIDFSNTLHPTKQFNVFDYMYFYNGGGIGAGDFNNDGRIDLFFASNQENNRLYLNTGNLHFRDVTATAHIPADKGWSTGVSVVDINNDGLLDIYVCRVGQLAGLPVSHNQLLICQGIGPEGIPIYRDEAAQYGLDFSGFSTQAAFFDYDGDGDLDMYLLNHTLRQNGTYGPRQEKLKVFNPYSGDHIFRNDGNGHFTDVTKGSGIHSSVIGYGLGIAVADIDLDGFPDIYVCNDFHENDYLYINRHDGTFSDETTARLMHTSQYSMGVDVADVNNDAFPEIISMDMLPYDPYILKRSEGEDTWDIFNMKIGYGYNYQYTRNNLQLNRRNGHFSEIGLYAGVAATDWSWSALWIDFDNDGQKDLFVTNGIPKRLNDIDYINFISNQELQEKMRSNSLDDKDLNLIDKFPQIRLPSKFFRNAGNMRFTDEHEKIAGAKNTFSNGAVYADLDNDGDLDLVVNNIDEPALIYRNTANDSMNKPFVDVRLKGDEHNINALGSKLVLFTGGQIRTYEKYPVRGFLSSMELPLHIGLDHTHVDSVFLIWPDNTCQRIGLSPARQPLTFTYTKGLPLFDYAILKDHRKNPARPMEDITKSTGLLHKHKENDFHEFDREPLIPHMLSTEGPALAVGDINKDGLQDVFIGSSKWEKSVVFLQQPSGKFIPTVQPDLDKDSTYEDVDACWADVNMDGNPDLLVASGGNEYYGDDPKLTPRVYLGDGKGHLSKLDNAFTNLFINASCITVSDIDGDGFPDLFIGGRSVPFNYGQVPRSYLLRGDGKGKFMDATEKFAPGLAHIGFVTSAQWFDLDKDGRQDLLLTTEWGSPTAFLRQGNGFIKKILTNKKGWWNFLLPVDIDGDGDIDLVAGNLGLNSRLHASETEPVRLYYNDFDGNGKKEQVLTYYLNGKELPFANKSELEKQMPTLKKNFLYAEDFAKASLNDLFPVEQLRHSDTLMADYFSNALLINDGHLDFQPKALPWEAQLSSYRGALVINANNDSLPDVLLVGNYYDNNIQMGRYDADYGTILLNEGHDSVTVTPINGLVLKGQVRHIHPIDIHRVPSYILVRNNDSTCIIRFSKTPGNTAR